MDENFKSLNMVNSGKPLVGRYKRESSSNRKEEKDRHSHKTDASGGASNPKESKDSRPDKRRSDQISTSEQKRESKSSRFDIESERSRDGSSSDHHELLPKKFSGRCRLFVGNVPPETREQEFESWFKPYGECSEIFLNAQRGFGFIRMVGFQLGLCNNQGRTP